MFIVPMYHRIMNQQIANATGCFTSHLKKFTKNYSTIFPGEISKNPSVCLTFDDAYYDFYYFVYPLLKKLNLKATLAVPTKFIIEDTDLAPEMRLKNIKLTENNTELFADPNCGSYFCTFRELQEMVDSGLVKIASHSHSHADLTNSNIDLNEEIIGSKNILQQRLQTEIDTFVYPFGKTNSLINNKVKQHYKYAMRIGNALNFCWKTPYVYRLNAENYWPKQTIPNFLEKCGLFFKYFSNLIRNK
jgi:peptidoglycan/xylan/chitin deacetylase (PgdA/CDA1 family)